MKPNCCRNKSEKDIKQVIKFLKVISEGNRLRILCVLQNSEKCVCEIWQFLDSPQNLISYHLKVLKDFGLIGSRKEGTKIFYFLNKKVVKRYTKLLSRFLNQG